jgi:cytidine deaminase
MFHAQGAAFRSADLGRQVGAVISSSDGEILAVGTNEVPKYGGGQFWPEDEKEPDPRDWVREHDWNDEKKRELIRDLLIRLTKLEKSALPMNEAAVDSLLNGLFSSRPDPAVRGALVMDIIGFYRSVHAETAAIIDAARRGVSVRDCIMYATAFPCHECTRHILASGIRIVRYIEPYPKSLAEDQYPDSIEVSSSGTSEYKLVLEPFVGIAPRQYMHLFAKNKRKQRDGTVIKWRANECKLRYGRPLDFFTKVEHNWSRIVEKHVNVGGSTE